MKLKEGEREMKGDGEKEAMYVKRRLRIGLCM